MKVDLQQEYINERRHREALQARVAKLEAQLAEARDVLSELVDLMQGVIDGDYKPDSFTLQPANRLLGRRRE